MSNFGIRSIRFKLVLTVLATTFAALAVAGAALIYNDVREYRRELESELITQADILGQASAAALEFDDARVAQQNLALLKAKPAIQAAALYTARGKLFAQYPSATGAQAFPALPSLDGFQQGPQSLSLYRRVVNRDEILGTVYLRARYDLSQRLRDYLGILAGVMLASLLVALAVALRLQSYVARPILSVSAVARQVVQQRDFSLRAAKNSDDEIGYLVDAFNDMLAEIGRRTEALETARHALEHEIAERREVQKALQDSERRNRLLVSAMSSVVWNCDAIGCFAGEQASWSDYTGQNQDDHHGLGWRQAFHPEDQAALDRAWAQALAQPDSFELEARLWHAASARYRYVSLRAVPFTQDGDRVNEWLGTITDIDDRRHAEAEVRTLNAELEQRVTERTGQLEEANRDLESFSYSVSHDLRAPVRAVAGFSHMLEKRLGDKMDEESRRLFGIIVSEAARMGQLINDLLAFSRLGRQAMQFKEVDMRTLARQTYEQLRGPQPDTPIQFQLGALPPAQGDHALLGQVWVNLLSNAIKFSSKREQPVIEVGAIADDEKYTYYVRDNGAGFDATYKAKLFGVFQRLHAGSEFPGTGVGLALVHRIITRHGGQVWADGAPDQGATFYFTLPKESSHGRV
ncbi:ATP-binding protein [Chitinimonas koreensis]|uniref:ATP-binding protein n=1 Tax=Chitinimonas koreensis TaxID=356302 RepID=UPI0003FB85C0|nr:ATP-binding protein [Chitinimonas koreensis]QNM95394.1 PAS domain-containing protein [Chitinimonas koreensis]